MARQADYAAKIEVLQKKIAKKSEELKVLKAELADWKKKKEDEDMKELHEFMAEKDMEATRALKNPTHSSGVLLCVYGLMGKRKSRTVLGCEMIVMYVASCQQVP